MSHLMKQYAQVAIPFAYLDEDERQGENGGLFTW